MKRYVSLACIAMVLVMCLVSPVSAEELDNDYFYNVLDYVSANGSGTNMVYVADGSKVTFPFITDQTVYYIDVVFQSSYDISGVTAVVGVGSDDLTLLSLSDNLYRAYGNIGGWSANQLDLFFDSASGAWIEFKSIHVSVLATNSFTARLSGVINYTDGSKNFVLDPHDSTPATTTIYYTGDIAFSSFVVELASADWKKYDFLDIQLMCECNSISTVSAMMGEINIPFEYTVIQNSNLGTSYYITLRMDLRGLDRTSTDYPMVLITGNLDYDEISLFSIMNCSGHLLIEAENPHIYWLKTQTNKILGSIVTLQGNINSWISNQTVTITSSLSVFQSNINSWISNQTTSLSSALEVAKISLMENIYAFRDEVWGLRFDLDTWIKNQTSILEAAIRGDTSPGDSFQQQVEQKDQQLNDMAAVMESVDQPDLNSVNVSANTYVDGTVLAASMSGITSVFSQGLFFDLIVMSIMMATAGYVLFGKR